MKRIKLKHSSVEILQLCLGTWAFGNDRWWGHQEDRISSSVLEAAMEAGVTFIDTAPIYGRGHSEELVGEFIEKNNFREKVVVSTKFGLRWEGRHIHHDLSQKQMMMEVDNSRKRLKTDYIDLYQAHWPDPEVDPRVVADNMNKLVDKGYIKAIGVSNFSLEQIKQFNSVAPLDFIQPPFNMFRREVELEIVPYCIENGISILAYSPLHNGVLTGKFFKDGAKVPGDIVRKYNKDLSQERFQISKDAVEELSLVAKKNNLTMTQLAILWLVGSKAEISAIVGARTVEQLRESICLGKNFLLNAEDLEKIEEILAKRDLLIE